MDLKEHDALGEQAATHWYYVSKARMIARHLPEQPNSVLDVGAGIGWFSEWLIRNGLTQACSCVDPGYDAPERCVRVGDGQIRYLRSVDQTDADVVLLMDVLEHVDDDAALLGKYWKLAKPGTVFIITVPAFQFLWSSHDEFLEHRRRYTAQGLQKTIRLAGAEPASIHYFFGSILPVAFLVRLLRRQRTSQSSDMSRVPRLLNGLLTVICSLESQIARFNKIAGLSVVATIRKPQALASGS